MNDKRSSVAERTELAGDETTQACPSEPPLLVEDGSLVVLCQKTMRTTPHVDREPIAGPLKAGQTVSTEVTERYQ